jgi:hypothetical protein
MMIQRVPGAVCQGASTYMARIDVAVKAPELVAFRDSSGSALLF